MFGYVKTQTPELRVRENEYYRAVYCGLCKSEGKCTGQCSRFTLSYDITFLALVRMVASRTNIEFKHGNCIAHPFKRRSFAKRNPELDFCAYASALLVWGKCRDDISDESGAKKLKARLARPFVSHMRKKSVKKYADLDRTISDLLKKLYETEQKKLPSVDIPADCFGDILGNVCSYGYEGGIKKITYDIGRHIGRWVYIADAIDDCEEDLEKGRFNPFLCLYGGRLPTKEERANVADTLRLELSRAELAFDLLDYEGYGDIQGIIENIIYLGMPGMADRLAGISQCECDSKNKKKNKKSNKNKNSERV